MVLLLREWLQLTGIHEKQSNPALYSVSDGPNSQPQPPCYIAFNCLNFIRKTILPFCNSYCPIQILTMIETEENMKLNTLTLVYLALFSITQSQSMWQSKIIHWGENGKLVYERDTEGNRIPDFSYAGYMGGGVPLPQIPVKKTIAPVKGDNTMHIQSAIDEVGNMPPDKNGFRGALLLQPGYYPVSGTLKIKYSGVILRGSGDGEDTTKNTVIFGTGDIPHQRTLLIAGGGGKNAWRSFPKTPLTGITSDTILLGENSFAVENTDSYKVGDNIIICHPCTEAWLKKIDYGATNNTALSDGKPKGEPWKVGEQPVTYNRIITAISGNRITVNVPVYYTLIKQDAPSYIYKIARKGILNNIGIENLRVDIENKGGEDEDHVLEAIELTQLEDSWVRDCTMLHYVHAGINTSWAVRVTIANCKSIDPVSIITGKRRYNFCVSASSQQILFYKCYAQNGRHHFISNGTSSASCIVFLECTSKGTYAASEGHRRWSQALLFDNITELESNMKGKTIVLGLYNRGSMGTSHGWASVNSVAWNYKTSHNTIIIQKPPTAQNYAVGCTANVTGKHPPAPFEHPEGYIEGTNSEYLSPVSLYRAQLSERLGKDFTTGDVY